MSLKLAVAVADKEAPPAAFVVWRGFEESIAKAAALGYHGVELALKHAEEIDPDTLQSWLSKHDMEVSCISTGQVFATLGLYFTHPDPAMRRQVVELFKGLVELAKDFGQLINVGRTRGFVGKGQSRAEAEQLFIETSQEICDFAAEKGVTIIIEPVNRYEINFVNNLDEGAELLAKVGRDNLGLMPDVFHMNIEDAQIGESLIKHAELVKYIHFADSNRWAPGWGHLDFGEVFDSLRQADFDGWSSIEILPVPDPDSAARQAAETILPMLAKYNKNR
jgi:sugar phosphate isomerase/epimerase